MSIFLRVATFAACAVGAGAVCAQSLGEIAGGAAANATGSAQSAQQAQQQSAAGQPLGQAAGAQSGEAKKTDASAAAAHTHARVGQQLAAGAKNSVSESELESLFLKASKGDAQAQLALGVIYSRGLPNVPQNGAAAQQWLEKAAAQNNTAAMNFLSMLYSDGKLVERNVQKAVYWREKAAELGTPTEQYALANSFIYGYMLPADKQKAFYWLEKAGAGGHIGAIDQLISIYKNAGDAQKLSYWRAQKSQAQLKLAQAGDADAMYEVYRKFLSGKGGFSKSIPRAVFWLRNAADRGHRRSMELLASMYIEGRFVGKDFSRGVSMLETLAKTDPVFAVRLSNVYSEDGEHKDVQKASMWLDRAAEKLDGINKIHLVWKVWAGSGVLRDTAKASKYCDDIIAAEKSAGLKALAEKIKKSIADGVPAPANFGDLYK